MTVRSPSRPKFVPDAFVARTAGSLALWHSPGEPTRHVDALSTLVTSAVSRVSDLMAFLPARPLHVCVFHSLRAMQDALDRPALPTMLMAPYLGDDASLIVCASPSVDVRNGDADRMLRHLAHEIVHCFVAEVSGSVKVLGDGNVGRRVPAWLDEGLAEVVSLTVSGRDEVDAPGEPAPISDWTEDDANARLDALDSPDRAQAFAWATARVRGMAARTGIAALFASLSTAAGA